MGPSEAPARGARRVGGAVELMRPATAQSQSSPAVAIKCPLTGYRALPPSCDRQAPSLSHISWRTCVADLLADHIADGTVSSVD